MRQDGRLVGGVCEGNASPSYKKKKQQPDCFQMRHNRACEKQMRCISKFTFERFKVLHCLPENSELVHFTAHALAGGDHGGQLVNEIVHFIPPPLLNLAVRLSVDIKHSTI